MHLLNYPQNEGNIYSSNEKPSQRACRDSVHVSRFRLLLEARFYLFILSDFKYTVLQYMYNYATF